MMREAFLRTVDRLASLLRDGEVFCAGFAGEESDFVRFSRSRVRQAGSVEQRVLTVDWIEGRRHAAGTLALSGDPEADRPRLAAMVEALRERRAQAPEDPFLLLPAEPHSTERVAVNRLPDPDRALAAIQQVGNGRDLVGIYAGGAVHTGFASSSGQRNWSTIHSFNLDWSFFTGDDAAVKASYAGAEWRDADFARKVSDATAELAALARPPRSVRPGGYRVYLAPAAVAEIVDLLGWGGFGLRARRTRTTPLLRMIEEEVRLHPSVMILENTAAGVAPDFGEMGFRRPERVTLVGAGACGDPLVSPRSAAEYGAPCNGASWAETPLSPDVAGGDLPAAEALDELHTGIWVSNLHYLNYSDRSACRITGLTRFATFFVRGGKIEAPLEVMRFDETLYRMLGDNLIALTRERETILDAGTYGGRSSRSTRVPGALIDDFRFTL